jgi:hypothetical protein
VLPPARQDSATILSAAPSNGAANVYDLSLLPSSTNTSKRHCRNIAQHKRQPITCETLAEGEVEHAEQCAPGKGAKRKQEPLLRWCENAGIIAEIGRMAAQALAGTRESGLRAIWSSLEDGSAAP